MKGDFSRDTFNAKKHFSRVLQQQGRVQLDADTNEQTAILLHYLQTLAADLIGPYGGPAEDGFKISLTEDKKDLNIGEGRYYVDGVLCENDKDDAIYTKQDDYPSAKLPDDKPYLVYLDVWEQHITALEDDDICEKALGGPDTATRTKVVWQVKVDKGNNSFPIPQDSNIIDTWNKWINRWQPDNRGCLKARVKPSEKSTEPCLTAPDAKYRGQENQLYRIEIHRKGEAKQGGGENYATFKWSRDNGSVVSRVVKFSGTELIVEKPQGFEPDVWVELSSEGQELRGEPGSLVKLVKVERDHFTLESEASRPSDLPGEEDWPTKVRRWDQRECEDLKLKDGAVPITEVNGGGNWIEIENGIEIQFQKSGIGSDEGKNVRHQYRTGDYWLIPARVVTGNIEWPEDNNKKEPCAQSPHGIQHHYAPLAIILQDQVKDLRCKLEPLGKLF